MAFDPTVHHSVKTREGTMPGRVTPYMIIGGLEGQVYLQDGKFLTPGGEVIPDDEVPQWVWDAAMSLPAQAREDIGFQDFPVNERGKAGERAPREQVDLRPQQGNVPMQLGEGEFEDDGKATPVPQDQETKTGKPPAPAQPAKAALPVAGKK